MRMVLLQLVFLCFGVVAEARAAQVVVDSLEVTNSPGVSGLEQLASQSIKAMLARSTLIHYPKEGSGQSSIGDPRVDELPNPFIDAASEEPVIVARLRIEIERVEYSEPSSFDDELVAFWAFGLAGTPLKRSDSIQGVVQFRAWLTEASTGREIEQVGIGLYPGRVRDLSRTRAIQAATCRAAWDLVTELGFKVNSEWTLGNRSMRIPLRREDYRLAVDALWADTQALSDLSGKVGIIIQDRRVVRVVDGSPAQAAGLLEGDVLLAVDGATLNGKMEHDGQLLRGEPGSRMTLRFLRLGQVQEVALLRAR